MKITILFVMLIASLLGGCAHTDVKVVEKHSYTLYEPDEAYLGDCKVDAPPSTKEYMAMSPDQREDALARHSLAQQKNLASCTLDKRSIRSGLEKSREIIQKRNDAELERVNQELKKLGEKNG